MALHHFPEQLQCSGLVSGLGGKDFEDLALVIDGPPQIMLLAVDLHKHLVEMPAPMGIQAPCAGMQIGPAGTLTVSVLPQHFVDRLDCGLFAAA